MWRATIAAGQSLYATIRSHPKSFLTSCPFLTNTTTPVGCSWQSKSISASCSGTKCRPELVRKWFDTVTLRCLKGLHVFSSQKTEVTASRVSSGVLLWHKTREKTLQLHGVYKQGNSFISALFIFLAFVREWWYWSISSLYGQNSLAVIQNILP